MNTPSFLLVLYATLSVVLAASALAYSFSRRGSRTEEFALWTCTGSILLTVFHMSWLALSWAVRSLS